MPAVGPAGPEAGALRVLADAAPSEVSAFASRTATTTHPFKSLSLKDLQELRRQFYSGVQPSHETVSWLEAILRFCELNMWRFDLRMREKWGDARVPGTVATAALLLEGHLVLGDPRFLNTVLKIRGSRVFRMGLRAGASNDIAMLAAAIADVSDTRVQLYQKR
jgi:hypothetical protein